MTNGIQIAAYIAASVLFILALGGLSGQESAKRAVWYGITGMGIAIIACLAYNMLLGQGGMLSFGHAVYSGLGSFLAIHALNHIGDGSLHLPVSLLPSLKKLLAGWVVVPNTLTVSFPPTLMSELVYV